jgi:TPR repeat protein
MYNLGLQYLYGKGAAQSTQGYVQARFEKAATAGDSSAMIQLGDLYRDGLGVTKS